MTQKSPLTITEITKWADEHCQRTKSWPAEPSGAIPRYLTQERLLQLVDAYHERTGDWPDAINNGSITDPPSTT